MSIEGIPGVVRLARKPPYALATIGARRLGRSRPITGENLDLSAEAIPWQHEVRADGSPIPIEVTIWQDHGDKKPKRMTRIQAEIASPYPAGPMELGGEPRVKAVVDTHEVPSDSADVYVPRVGDGLKHGATIVVPTVVVVTIDGIRGLHKPVATGKSGVKRAEATPGYVSEDDLGRAYLDRDLDGKWRKGTQLIELHAKVDVRSGSLPGDAKVRWTMIGVDDFTNDDPGFHSEWGPYVDARDYDQKGEHRGAHLGDNEGKPAHDPPWAEVAGFDLSRKTATSADTKIAGNESKVVLHCPSTAGDNFMVRAELHTSSARVDSFPHQTGIITMWHRLDVQVLKMASAEPLPVEDVPAPFEPACVQLDFAAPEEIADEQQIGTTSKEFFDNIADFVDRAFSKKSEPGWFCVIAALEPFPTPDRKGDGAIIYHGKVKLHATSDGWEYVEIPGTHSEADFIYLRRPDGDKIGFKLEDMEMEVVGGTMITRCWVYPHDTQPEFTAGDGSTNHAYAVRLGYGPRMQGKWEHTTTRKGYEIDEEPEAIVHGEGEAYAGGISPEVGKGGKPKVKKGDPKYFAGRTVVFTQHQVYFDRKTKKVTSNYRPSVTRVLVHELVHAFGMPHKCGYFDCRTPRTETCVMNYGWPWMVDAKRQLIPKTNGKTGLQLCGRHLKEVRRTQLHKNKGLAWK
ncbi:MAG TPA: hypothetical protein VKE22_30125 [Haliangiales bacterium]|nr:hypothetical protein [Haliangiales bacterium]